MSLARKMNIIAKQQDSEVKEWRDIMQMIAVTAAYGDYNIGFTDPLEQLVQEALKLNGFTVYDSNGLTMVEW